MHTTSLFCLNILFTIANAIPISSPHGHKHKSNSTLQRSTIIQLDALSTQAQAASASTYILGYEGYGELLPTILSTLSNSLASHWSPHLLAAQSRLPACPGFNTTTAMQIPDNVVAAAPWDLFSNIFYLATNMLEELEAKQCDIDGYTPDANIKLAMRAFIDSTWAAMGTGSAVAKQQDGAAVPDGAMLPYYHLLKHCAPVGDSEGWSAPLYSLNEVLLRINGTNCVPS